MDAYPNVRAEIADQSGGVIWNRLHDEREEICEALLKEPAPGPGTGKTDKISEDDAVRTANWHRELLQARLRKLDDALDRLMSGSYGHCSKCHRWIEETQLDLDPAMAFCMECWQRKGGQLNTGGLEPNKREPLPQKIGTSDLLDNEIKISPLLPGIALESLAPYDTIWVQTRNSNYRIFLLDPRSGHALVEGGHHFVESVEAIVNGSTFGGSTIKGGWIGIGLRLEMRIKSRIASTSPVQSFRVEPHEFEPASVFSSAVH
jgi:RNA polymerase-binding transcription factor DksA